MKRLLFVWIFLLSSAGAFADEGFYVKDFYSEIDLRGEKVMIEESILVDIEDPMKGLGRFIPDEYNNGYDAGIEFIGAYDEQGRELEVDLDYQSGNAVVVVYTLGRELIGGEYLFRLRYSANNVFEGKEFYWNVNGTEWPVEFEKVRGKVLFDEGDFEMSQFGYLCFTGAYGANGEDCKINREDGGEIYFKADREFGAYEGLTIVIGNEPPFWDKIWSWLLRYWEAGLPLGLLVFMSGLWFLKGRDASDEGLTVIPHYHPPKGFRPTEVGALHDMRVDSRDVTALLLDYAVRGYLKIEEAGKSNHKVTLLKAYQATKAFEVMILSRLFPVNAAGQSFSMKGMATKLSSQYVKIQDSVMKDLVEDGYFKRNPNHVRSGYMIFGSFCFMGGMVFLEGNLQLGLALLACALLFFLFSFVMPRRTRKGVETYFKLKGLYEYIDTAEKDRMKFQEDAGVIFERLLPYAAAFGLIKKWSKAFEGLLDSTPSWYGGSGQGDFVYFGRSMGRMNSAVAAGLITQPGSRGGRGSWGGGSGFGGGGFSGGGFGGGGGFSVR